MVVRSTVRWAATHGAMRLAIRARARAGNPDAEVLVDPGVREDPYAHYERLRTAAPFAGGAFARVSVHHDVCTDVLRSDDFGQIGGSRTDGLPALLARALQLAGPRPSVGPIDAPSMLAVDPPEHTRYRRLVTRAFSARAVARLRERTEAIADELLDDLEREAAADDGRVDLVARYASLLPVTVISEVLGVPVAMREQFLAWGDGAAPSLDMGVDLRTHRSVERNLGELDAWFRGHLRQLRRSPGEDLLSTLVTTADDDGSGLTEHELLATATLVFGAGFETTVNLVANGAALLFAHPSSGGCWPRTRRCGPTPWTRSSGSSPRCSGPDGGPSATPRCTGCRSPRASWCCACWPRPTGTRGCSPTRTPSTSRAPTHATTSPSPAASTTAWAPRWPGWRARWRCGRCSSASPTSPPPAPAAVAARSSCAATSRCPPSSRR